MDKDSHRAILAVRGIDTDGVPGTGRETATGLTFRRSLAQAQDGSWRCGAYTATDYIAGFLIEGAQPRDVESLHVQSVHGQYSVEYTGGLEPRPGGAYASASDWPWTPAVFLSQAEVVVRFAGPAPEDTRVVLEGINVSPEEYDFKSMIAGHRATLGSGTHMITGSPDGYRLSTVQNPGLRLNNV